MDCLAKFKRQDLDNLSNFPKLCIWWSGSLFISEHGWFCYTPLLRGRTECRCKGQNQLNQHGHPICVGGRLRVPCSQHPHMSVQEMPRTAFLCCFRNLECIADSRSSSGQENPSRVRIGDLEKTFRQIFLGIRWTSLIHVESQISNLLRHHVTIFWYYPQPEDILITFWSYPYLEDILITFSYFHILKTF